ncbi:TIGR03032 family protein [Rubripirellula sp.]|nr:TIGR03032 family protein [Rubripirellula sp.]MDB4749972.1 TIGR03032 family protein [Rubripirellula sp.]
MRSERGRCRYQASELITPTPIIMSSSEVPPTPSDESSVNKQGDDGAPEPLRSVHTSNLPEILEHLGCSLMVSTYQAGRLVMLRTQNGTLNTHFRSFDKPMGLALSDNRLAVGAANSIWEFHNLPAVGEKLNADSDPPVTTQHDACFLPRVTHWTGDIQIHEMAWVGQGTEAELWFVNTRFSCLCIRSGLYNFQPVWRPSFITDFIPGDCCHLNGLGLRQGVPRYVTALGETANARGWRENKKDGGILMDVESGDVITRGLSMPHSPRWYQDRLWVLESGHGGLGYIESETGKYVELIALPGFTRGLAFCGPLAFVGLSQVRETAVFGGVPIAEKQLDQRTCGVWVVNIETAKTVAFVKFEDAVQEIFAVEVVPHRFPELVNEQKDLLDGSFELPDDALDGVPPEMRSGA